jgi:NDP-hexose 4-ketoreductase
MRVLLLGADGFLGRHVTDRLLADPAVQLTALGRRDSADVRFDLSTGSPGALARFMDAIQPGTVVNCAGSTVGSARDLVRSNTIAVATVCEAIRRSSCTARLVQVGSSAEYGPSPVGSSAGEEAPARPNGAYGVSKLAATELVLGSGLDAVVLRVFTPVGPGTPLGSPLGRIADAMRRAMQHGENDVRVGGLSALRDFVDVRDIARAVHAASLSAAQGVVNIGSGHAVRLRDAAMALARAAGFTGRLLEDEPGELSEGQIPAARRADAPRTAAPVFPDGCGVWQQADVRTARDRLGWRSRIALEESLADVWMEAACRV